MYVDHYIVCSQTVITCLQVANVLYTLEYVLKLYIEQTRFKGFDYVKLVNASKWSKLPVVFIYFLTHMLKTIISYIISLSGPLLSR